MNQENRKIHMGELMIERNASSIRIYPYDDETMEELKQLVSEKDDLSILIDMTEHYWSNGSYQPFDSGQGNPFVGLTNAPCIAESMSYDDNGNAKIGGSFWFYGDYMIYNFIQIIINEGSVTFTKA